MKFSALTCAAKIKRITTRDAESQGLVKHRKSTSNIRHKENPLPRNHCERCHSIQTLSLGENDPDVVQMHRHAKSALWELHLQNRYQYPQNNLILFDGSSSYRYICIMRKWLALLLTTTLSQFTMAQKAWVADDFVKHPIDAKEVAMLDIHPVIGLDTSAIKHLLLESVANLTVEGSGLRLEHFRRSPKALHYQFAQTFQDSKGFQGNGENQCWK
jgi:hypothetical protein